MEINSQALQEVTEEVLCDVCLSGTRMPGYGLQYGKLEAQWGYGSGHDGEHYKIHLCEKCFFSTLSVLHRERMLKSKLEGTQPFSSEEFALVSKTTTGDTANTFDASLPLTELNDELVIQRRQVFAPMHGKSH